MALGYLRTRQRRGAHKRARERVGQPVRLFMVDDSPAFLRSAADFLSLEPGFQVVGCAESGAAALDALEDARADAVLVDLAMPDMNGFELTRRIKGEEHPPRVVVLTLHGGPDYREVAQQAGADGFVVKSELAVGLVPLLRRLFVPGRQEG